MKTGPTEVIYSVPIRRTQWPSLFVGAAAVFASALAAAAFGGLLALSSNRADGAVVIIASGMLWGTIFFFSYPWQRRCARSFDLRRPGIRVDGGVVAVPLADDSTSRFRLDEPHELSYGWSESVVSAAGAPTTHTRGVLTYATLSQAGRQVYLKAEDSVSEAQAAGWPRAASGDRPPSEPAVRLWAKDLVALVETVRARPRRAGGSD
ncbi:MAG TPA: hypothetical protein VF586_00095 [Pyrinomonadaceae bacterium]